MKSQEIRSRFLQYFAAHHHTMVPSSSLVPGNDPTLLFTNAGMVQFKDVFLGQDQRSYQRAVSSQRCVRAGGKHNDLENVGYTARHHTFFEMLGNFSFGDYFKRDAIQMAWQFLTEELKLPQERLWVTVFDEDHEAAAIWLNEIGIDPARLSRIGAKDNFWAMGDTGPCGPCSEIFYDHGADVWGGPPGTPEEDGDRYIEIWNLVFMQFNRSLDGTLTPLPKPSVDTGMGLERLSAVLQGVHNNYDTDLFQPLIKAAAELAGCLDLTNQSLRVIADHLRASAFLIIDGVRPLNEGRGYVLRRIIRRAIRHGNKLGLQASFFYSLVPALVAVMGDAYPELSVKQAEVQQVLQQEEEQFARTLAQGLKLLSEVIATLGTTTIIPGDAVFKLYDTYGFPMDLTADIAREKGLTIDTDGFTHAMAKQKAQSKTASKFSDAADVGLNLAQNTPFLGYEQLTHTSAIEALYQNGVMVPRLAVEESGQIILTASPFYAESGGQVGDRGLIRTQTGVFVVSDTQKSAQAIIHHGHVLSGVIDAADLAEALVDQHLRQATALNHSATHLLHAALQHVLGQHVEQKGSLVDSARLRFDFTHSQAMSAEQIHAVESFVNHAIRANYTVTTELMTPDAAKLAGAMSLFGEKYGAEVRVLSMGAVSKELCGGTHVSHTGAIGIFKILQESGVAAGIRRIEALTGEPALQWIDDLQGQLLAASALVKAKPKQLLERLQQITEQQKQQEKQLEQLQGKMAAFACEQLVSQVERINDVNVLVAAVSDFDVKGLKSLAEQARDRLGTCMVLLINTQASKVQLIAVASADVAQRCHAGQLVTLAAHCVGGKGGGKPDFAQAAGDQAEQVPNALVAATTFIHEHLQRS